VLRLITKVPKRDMSLASLKHVHIKFANGSGEIVNTGRGSAFSYFVRQACGKEDVQIYVHRPMELPQD
jgi:hypothetical protein